MDMKEKVERSRALFSKVEESLKDSPLEEAVIGIAKYVAERAYREKGFNLEKFTNLWQLLAEVAMLEYIEASLSKSEEHPLHDIPPAGSPKRYPN